MSVVTQIAKDLSLDAAYVNRIVRTARHLYKEYEIPKRTSGKRKIQHPARQLKLLQVWVAERIMAKLPVHKSATAYMKNSDIVKNARVHKAQRYLLRVDFKNFFESISDKDVVHVLAKNQEHLPFPLSGEDRSILAKIVCRNNALTIGAPSSPSVANAVMYEFDEYWSRECSERGIKYTRYADDLYFSTSSPNVLEKVLPELRLHLKTINHPNLTINGDKSVFSSKKNRRVVTGIVITPSGKLSIGRARKRYLKSLIFRFSHQELNKSEVSYLRGLLNHACHVEPMFERSIREKYGDKVIDEILSSPILSRKDGKRLRRTHVPFDAHR